MPVVNTFQQMRTLNEKMAEKGTVLLIKLHPFQSRRMVHDVEGMSHIRLIEHDALLKNDIQINQLLGYADALISDYSSVAVDYLVLDRPMAFTPRACNCATRRLFTRPA